MENEHKHELPEEQEGQQPETQLPEDFVPYVPRPLWQVIGAWVALIIFIAVIAFYYIGLIWGG